MAEVSRINFEESSRPREIYNLSGRREEMLNVVLPHIQSLPYWSPDYQAWEPFLISYAADIGHVELSESLTEKVIDFHPLSQEYRHLFECLYTYINSGDCHEFSHVSWSELRLFLQEVRQLKETRKTPTVEDSIKVIQKLDSIESFPFAIFLFKNNVAVREACNKELLNRNARQYGKQFMEAFDAVRRFIGKSEDNVGSWYSGNVRDIISGIWSRSIEDADKEVSLSHTLMFNMAVWVSEQLKDYVATLPCCCNYQYTFADVGASLIDYRKGLAKSSEVAVPSLCIGDEDYQHFYEILTSFYERCCCGDFVADLGPTVHQLGIPTNTSNLLESL